MMVKVIITETCRAMGRNQQWFRFKDHEINADTVAEAKEELIAYLDNGIYNVKRPRQSVYVDTESRGTIRTGYIYSGIEDTNYLQAWCSFYFTEDNKNITAIDLDTPLHVIEIYPNGDPFGRGFQGSESKNNGISWFFRGDIGATSRDQWRAIAHRNGATLRNR